MLVVNGENLKAAMIDAGFSITELARRTGLMPRIISELIHKKNRFVRLKTLSKIKRELDISLADLILCDVRRSDLK